MIARQSSDELRAQTQALVTALRRPEARGRWGEMQLRRVVEIAGMDARCDFDEQVSVSTDEGTQRPDMVIRLAGGKNIVVDSKVSLAAYLEAAEATDDAVREARLDAHARHLREHVDRLAAKAYWAALSPAPEFVVLFIPGEAFLAPALEHDPALLEHAIAHRVHIATPTTLVTMLRTAQYAWQQEALSENARAVFDLGRELYDRLAGMGRHMEGLGKALANAVSGYNKTIGSLETRVLVTARKLNRTRSSRGGAQPAAGGGGHGPDPVRARLGRRRGTGHRHGARGQARSGERTAGDGRGRLTVAASTGPSPRTGGGSGLPQRAWTGRLSSLREAFVTDSHGPDTPADPAAGPVAAVVSPSGGTPPPGPAARRPAGRARRTPGPRPAGAACTPRR